jgi:hypothetical protein
MYTLVAQSFATSGNILRKTTVSIRCKQRHEYINLRTGFAIVCSSIYFVYYFVAMVLNNLFLRCRKYMYRNCRGSESGTSLRYTERALDFRFNLQYRYTHKKY